VGEVGRNCGWTVAVAMDQYAMFFAVYIATYIVVAVIIIVIAASIVRKIDA
jgi:hypothetical protein